MIDASPTLIDRASLQRTTIRTLVLSQVLSGVGMASGIAVGALLAEELSGSEALAGLGTTAQVLGGALIAIPTARIMAARGRRPGLQFGYALAFIGAALVVTAAVAGSFPLMLVGMLLFGGGTAGNGQARYAAADLAEEHRRGRDLSIVVWATTIGSVLGPNLVGPGKDLARVIGIPDLAGSFLFSLAGFVLAFLVINRLLRPDPLLTSRALERAAAGAAAQRHPDTVVPARAEEVADELEPTDAVDVGQRHPRAEGVAAELEPTDTVGWRHPEHTMPARAEEIAAELEPTDTVGAGSIDADVLVDHDGSLTRGLGVLRAKVDARLGMLTMALGHVVMVGVMVMTPIHMQHGAAGLEVIGFVISIHILGMYALSPVVGLAVDRWGGRPVAATGGGILTLAARSMPGWSGLLLGSLFLLGVGWSCTLVSGSTMLTIAVTAEERPAAQGVSEVFMGLAGAGGGAIAGVVVQRFGYATLATGAAVVGVAIIVLIAVLGRARA